MNKSLLKRLLAGLFALGAIVSCGSPKRYAYMQDVELMQQYQAAHLKKIKIEPGDRLSIAVSSSYPELIAPFNGGAFQNNIAIPGLAGAGNNIVNGHNESQELRSLGYLVDRNGDINFPVLGKIRLAGLATEEAARLIEQKIIASKYVTDPRAEVAINNFQVYLLGAIAGSNNNTAGNFGGTTGGFGGGYGTYNMFNKISGVAGGALRINDREKVNILEALSMVGDLPINANIEKVNVIRQEAGGKLTTYRLNLKSMDIVESPGFYLKQNDIIYVEHRYRRSEMEGIERILQVAGFVTSSIATVVAVLALTKK